MLDVCRHIFWIGFAATIFLLAMIKPVYAGSFEVAPTTLSLADGETAVFYVINHSNESIIAQVEGFAWRQDDRDPDNKDQYDATSDLIISPPMVRLAPNQQQTIRLMAKRHMGAALPERSFRLSVSEIPDPALANTNDGIRMLLQFSVPVFVHDQSVSADKMAWTAESRPDGLLLTARNQGQRHTKLSALSLVPPSGEALPVNGGGFRYILANSTSSWTLPLATATSGQTVHVKAFDDIANTNIDVPLTVQ